MAAAKQPLLFAVLQAKHLVRTSTTSLLPSTTNFEGEQILKANHPFDAAKTRYSSSRATADRLAVQALSHIPDRGLCWQPSLATTL